MTIERFETGPRMSQTVTCSDAVYLADMAGFAEMNAAWVAREARLAGPLVEIAARAPR